MRHRRVMHGIVAAIFGAAVVGLAAQQSARELFERARLLEAAKQDPTEVIRLYQQAASAADAADPTLATAARDAIARLTTQATERVLWAGDDLPPGYVVAVSPDARSVAYIRGYYDLVLRDVATGRDRELTESAESRTAGHREGATYAAFSADGTRLAYNWQVLDGRGPQQTLVDELRVIDLHGTGMPVPRVLFRDEDTGGYAVKPVGWTPDGSQIAVVIGHAGDRTQQLGLVSSKDGALTVLRSHDWRDATGVSLSPDGRYMAFDLPADEQPAQRDVFVLALDGGQPVPAVTGPWRDQVVGWSPDGSRLLFTRDQRELWAQPMTGGKPQGNPSLVKADARGTNFRMTAAGTLFEMIRIDTSTVHTARVDFATGRALGPPTPVPGPWPSPQEATWSPDGMSLLSKYNTGGDTVVAIHAVHTGDTRVLSLPVAALGTPYRWTSDGGGLLARAQDLNGRDGIYRIDLQSGKLTALALPPPNVRFIRPQLSSDQSRLYFVRDGGGNTPVFVERDLTAGTDRELFQLDGPIPRSGMLSPDGRFLPRLEARAGAPRTISLISTEDNTERELLRVDPPAWFVPGPVAEWTADSRFAIVMKHNDQGKCELWSIHVADAQARKLDVGVPNLLCSRHQISPIPIGENGGQVAFFAGTRRAEIRVIDRFLPAAKR